MRGQRRWLWAVGVALFIGSAATADRQPAATVQVASGTVTVRRPAAAAGAPLREREALYAGDVVSTGADGRATLVFSDGSQVRLNVDSAVEITTPTSVRKGKQSLFRAILGEIWSRLRPGRAAQTRSAIAGVRGTEFHLGVEDDGSTTLTVLLGEVDFFNDYGAVVVGESQQSVARPDTAPTAPVTIGNAGLIIEWTLDLDRALIPRESFFISPDRSALEGEAQAREERARTDPDDVDARRDYGDVLFDTGRYDQALGEYEAASRVAPGQAAVLTRLGDALLELRQMDEAVEAYNAALGADPQHVPAVVGLAWTGLARNRPEEAQAAAEGAVAADPDSAQARLALGLALMRQPGRLADAAAAFQAALDLEPAAYRYQARAWLALVHLAQDDPAAALEEAQAAVELAPQSALAHGNLALARFFNGQAREAEREARKARQLNPDSVAARCALGQALLAEGDVDAAGRTAAQAVALDPTLPQARYLLGVADAQRRDYRSAAHELTECLRLAPDFLPAASALARVYTFMGRESEAVALLTDLLARHADADKVLAALGAVQYQQSNYDDAIGQYHAALELNPNSALYHAELARVCVDANRLSDAIQAGEQAVRLAPEIGQYHAILGLAYDFSRMGVQAEREFREALALDPRNALAQLVLGLKAAEFDPEEHRIIPKKSGQSPLELLRQGLQAAGSSPVVGSIAQGFLYDPAVSTQVMRGGIGGELTPSVGTNSPLSLSATHRAGALDGSLHSFGAIGRDRDHGVRPNDDTTQLGLSENLTYVTDRRTNLFARVSQNQSKQGLPGSVSVPDDDDRANARDSLIQLGARRRIGDGHHAWVAVSWPNQHFAILDPELDSMISWIRDPDGNTLGFSTPSQSVRSHGLVGEARLDIDLAHNDSRPTLLTLGATAASLDPVFETILSWSENGDVPTPVDVTTALDGELTAGYVQLTQRVSDNLSFAAQIRHQTFDATTETSLLGGGVDRVGEKESYWLPSAVVNYRPDRRSLVRLFYNRQAQKQDLIPVALRPLETLLTTEPLVMPKGLPDETETWEVDLERYLSSRDFLKVFLFNTTADNVNYGDLPTMHRVERKGVGFRYERQFSDTLYGQLAYLCNQTANQTPFAPFDGGTAPYHPSRLAGIGLNYVDPSGNKVGLQLNYTGPFFQDTGVLAATDRPRFGGRTYVDLTLAREPSVHEEYFVKVTNVFNSRTIQFNDCPSGQRRIVVGATKRF